MYHIHPNARTTPAVRAEIARSTEPSGELAKHYGVSTETIRKWRKRGVEDCRDHSSRPTHLRWRATDEERAIVCPRERLRTAMPCLATDRQVEEILRTGSWQAD